MILSAIKKVASFAMYMFQAAVSFAYEPAYRLVCRMLGREVPVKTSDEQLKMFAGYAVWRLVAIPFLAIEGIAVFVAAALFIALLLMVVDMYQTTVKYYEAKRDAAEAEIVSA
jgi:cytochrome c oxidase assembly protein Cox11